MKYFEIELKGQPVKLRLTGEHCIEIEKKYNTKMLDYIKDYSNTTIITLLKYLRRSELPQFSEKDANSLYDDFVDEGFTLDKIVYDVIYEALVVSGFLTKEDLEKMKKVITEAQTMIESKATEILQTK